MGKNGDESQQRINSRDKQTTTKKSMQLQDAELCEYLAFQYSRP